MPIQRTRRERSGPALREAVRWDGVWTRASLVGGSLSLGIFLFYEAVYHVRGYINPIGFDASWYIWRAEFVAARGIGPLDTTSRPGHALLLAVLQSLTRLSQPQLSVIVSLLLVAVFALAVASFSVAALGPARLRWPVAIAVTGTVLGTTYLVSENMATALFLALAVAAMVPLLGRATGGRGMWGAVVLLVAAGLSHWLFLAVLGGVLALAAAALFPESLRRRRLGEPWLGTESGVIGAVVLAVAAAMSALIFAVLRAPANTIEMRENPARFPQKLRGDLRQLRLPLTGPVALIGAWVLSRGRLTAAANERPAARRRRFGLLLLASWFAVSALGVLYGVVTNKIPPHRFLELIVAVPGTIVLTQGVLTVAGWLRSGLRRNRNAGGGPAPAAAASWPVALVLVAIVALPGAVTWYRSGPGVWIDRNALQQATTASGYIDRLPPGTPFVFLVSQVGPAGILSTALKERTIRMALPPDRQEDMYLYSGRLSGLLAGRPTLVRDPLQNHATLPYWNQARLVLPRQPPILMLDAFDTQDFGAAQRQGGRLIAPGVVLLGGLAPAGGVPAATLPRLVPNPPVAFVSAAVILLLLFVAGLGWARAFVDPGSPPEVVVGLAPAVGAGMLILGALPPALAGVGLGGVAGVAVFVVVTAAGWALARRVRTAPGAGSATPAP
jgi:hypothetical protein